MKFTNQNAVQNVLLANEIVQQWQLFYKRKKDVDVYGMHDMLLKILKTIVVVDKNSQKF